MRKSVLAAAAAVSMISLTGGALAQSAAPLGASAAPLSVAGHFRAGADLRETNDIRGGFILPALAIIAIIAVIYVVTKDNSASP